MLINLLYEAGFLPSGISDFLIPLAVPLLVLPTGDFPLNNVV